MSKLGWPFAAEYSVVLACVIFLLGAQAPNEMRGPSAEAQTGQNSEDEPAIDTDTERPLVRILSPSACSAPVGSPGIVIARGTAADDLSGVSKVEAFSHTYPFDENYPFRPAIPSAGGDWSSWSIPLEIYENSTRILVRATDNAGNENWDEVVIDPEEQRKLLAVQSHEPEKSVAFVEPSFTDAAYGVGGFYEFYAKHQNVRDGEVVTADLDLMIAEIPSKLDRQYYEPILQTARQFLQPDSQLTVINDIHVHDGLIFKSDGTNSLKALFLLHNEYVTQQEYDNLRRFVYNGGILVFIDSNAFYAEVSYDKENCTVTLVKGHDWEFNEAAGTVTKSVSERYFDENREWVGTNYMVNALWDPVRFPNVPFNYTHFEENYLSNPNATILHDYGMAIGAGYEGPDWHGNETIVAYEMRYGQGKNVGLGIYGQNNSDDPQFLDFFDKVILTHALGNEYIVDTGDTKYPVYWKMNSGQVNDISVDSKSLRLLITIEGSVDEGTLRLALPKNLIDVRHLSAVNSTTPSLIDHESVQTSSSSGQSPDSVMMPAESQSGAFVVTIRSGDGEVQEIGEVLAGYEIDYERIVEFPIGDGASSVEIRGTYVAPEFGLMSGYLAFAAILAFVLVTKSTWIRWLA